MRRILVVLSACAVSMTFSVAAFAAPVEQYIENGERTYASWEEEGEDTFVFTEVTLTDRTITEGGETFDAAFLEISHWDMGDVGFVQVVGEIELADDQYHLDARGGTFSASVEADLAVFGRDCVFADSPFADCTLIGPFDVTVAVTWDDATGRLYSEVFTSRTHEPDGFSVGTQKGLVRYTNASGEITGELSATLDASFVASISRIREGVRLQFEPT